MTDEIMKQPIVTFAGHVDHGKTSILDAIRGTSITKKEAGKITQKISFTIMPKENIIKRCKVLLDKLNIKLEIPGFLFIDTPGHAAFISLRKRGGSLANLAVLVIDINEGIKEQTRESIQVLKQAKTPFIIALNKVDKISGWRHVDGDIQTCIQQQSDFTKQELNNRLLNIITALSYINFDSAPYYEVDDFTKQIALVPCSAKTGEGMQDILVMLAGLAQRFLKGKLKLGKQARGTIFEIKKERVTAIEAILYDGSLSINDTIMIATFDKPIVTKIRSLSEALPLGKGFKSAYDIKAATGFRMYIPGAGDVMPGMPFIVLENSDEDYIQQQKTKLVSEVSDIMKFDKEGIVVKADSLGSLEALMFLLRKNGIMIKKAGIGNITKNDLAIAKSIIDENPLDAAIVGFNVDVEPTAKESEFIKIIKIINGDVVYKIVDDITEWRNNKEREMEREKLKQLTLPCKIKVLKHYIFRKSKPAIFGVKVLAGILKHGIVLMNKEGEKIDKIKTLQSEQKTVPEAKRNEEVAINLPNTTIGRHVKEDEILYSWLSEQDFRKLKENKKFLTQDELATLQEIAEISRKKNPVWGI